jgi:beta-glucanase (GH16 family)
MVSRATPGRRVSHLIWEPAAMSYRKLALLTLLLAASIPTSAQQPAPAPAPAAPATAADTPDELLAPPSGYELVWSDEFSTDGLPDPARWGYDTQRNRQGWYNNEQQYYAAGRLENSRIVNGNLIIEARAERLNRAQFPDLGRQRYTSARLVTQGHQAWTYGFFEMRATLPCGVGTWPAFWMLPEDPSLGWPLGGEIDIMEHVGHVPGEINQTIHTQAYNHVRNTHRTVKFMVNDACETMHRYQMLWTPNFIVTGVDGQPRFIFRSTPGDQARWPFNQPMHLLLNMAVGGDWGGQRGIDAAAFPARFEIDYVRVFQLPTPTPASPPTAGQ